MLIFSLSRDDAVKGLTMIASSELRAMKADLARKGAAQEVAAPFPRSLVHLRIALSHVIRDQNAESRPSEHKVSLMELDAS